MFVARNNCTVPSKTVYMVFCQESNLKDGPILGKAEIS